MKRIRTIPAFACSLLLLLISLTAAQAEGGDPVLARFSLGDMAISYVYAGATRDEAMETFGAPAETELQEIGATGEIQDVWYYDGLTLTFSEGGKLICAETDSASYIGPRGVAVGQTLQDVTGRFYRDPGLPSGDVLYTSGQVEFTDDQFPPCGYILRDEDGAFSLLYVAPVTPFGDDVLAQPMDFVYQTLATLVVHFSPDGTVKQVDWYLGAWAE